MHKDFDAAAREAVGESLTFTLGGEQFTTTPELPALPMLKLAAAADKDGAEGAAAFYEFVQAMLIPEDVDRFEAMAKRERLGMERLSDVVKWLIAELTGRPTQRPSDLPERPSNNSPSSTGGSLRRVIGEAS